MRIATKPQVGETRILLQDVGFDVYELLINAIPTQTAVRMAYDGRDLEIMVKGWDHDHYAYLLGQLITLVSTALDIPRKSLGQTTWIRPEIERGIEADQCYFFDAGKLALVRQLQARKEKRIVSFPNPDLAVEVDISRPQADRSAIYAALQVPELWICDGETVTIQHLGPEGTYSDADRSRWLPITAEDATRWVIAEDSSDEVAWDKQVRAWAKHLRERPEGSE